MTKKTPEEHEKAMVEAYRSGATAAQAAAPFGYSRMACLAALRRLGIRARNRSEARRLCKPVKRIPEEHREAMVEAYLSGESALRAAALLGYSERACLDALWERAIPTRSLSQAKRKYSVDETFFDVINTEAKAYWLGFITADGSVSSSNDTIQITLQAPDAGHLRKFATSLQSEHPISNLESRRRSHVRILIGSLRLTNALKRLGIVPNKTFTVTPCNQVPSELLRHYWRGVFDGDGSIYVMKNRPPNRPAWQLKLVGNRAMVQGFISFCRMCVRSQANIKPQLHSFNVKFVGVELVISILLVLYGNATIFLDRKKQIADQIIASNASVRQ